MIYAGTKQAIEAKRKAFIRLEHILHLAAEVIDHRRAVAVSLRVFVTILDRRRNLVEFIAKDILAHVA
jgi:hypothetical protein